MNDEFEDFQRFFASERRAARWLLAGGALSVLLMLLVAVSGGALA
jgi:hypothetical protein